jgi:TolB-like protein
VIRAEGDRLSIPRLESLRCDVWDFERFPTEAAKLSRGSVDAGEVIRILKKSSELRRGEFLKGFSLPDCPDLDDWQFQTEQYFELRYAALLEELADTAEAAGRIEEAVESAKKLAQADPDNEEHHRRLIRLYGMQGDKNAAERQYSLLVKRFRDTADDTPSRETVELMDRIRRSSGPGPSAGGMILFGKRGTVIRLPFVLAAGIVILGIGLWLTRPASLSGPVDIAVLPFKFLCTEEGADRFAESFTSELITILAKDPMFSVVPHASVRQYTWAPTPAAVIAKDLGVRYVLDGAAMKEKNRIRFSLQLVDTRSGECIWADTYECAVEDTLIIQERVIRFIKVCLRDEFDRSSLEDSHFAAGSFFKRNR